MEILGKKIKTENLMGEGGLNNKMDQRSKITSELKDRTIEMTQTEQQREDRLEKSSV